MARHRLTVVAALLLIAGASLLWLHRGSAMLLDLSFVGCL